MKTAVIIKVDSDVKKSVQKRARRMGLTLSAVMNAYLREFMRSDEVKFSLEPQELRPEVGRLLKRASADFRKGKNISPLFTNTKDMLDYLHSQWTSGLQKISRNDRQTRSDTEKSWQKTRII